MANPILNDVAAAFARIAQSPREAAIDRQGVILPKGGHFQGIQRLGPGPERLAITSSSDTRAYFVVCGMSADGTRGRAGAPVTLAEKPLNHAGGCQAVGSTMAVGVEDDAGRKISEIRFWNLAARPAEISRLTIKRSGAEKVSTAGAVGITSFRGGAVLAVGTWDAATVDFYATASDPLLDPQSRFIFLRTWTSAGANKAGWVDGNVGAYQSLNLLTQRDGRVFMLGFNRSGDEDWMDLYSVNLDAAPASMLRKIAKKHMRCTNGCSFRAGSGVYIASQDSLEIYAVKGDSGDHATGATIHVNHFMPA